MAQLVHADDTTFDHEVLQVTVPVVVDFWAQWCGPCRMVAPELEALAVEHGDAIKVVKVDVDAAPAIARRYAISGIPTIARFRDGQPAGFSVGAKLRQMIEAAGNGTRISVVDPRDLMKEPAFASLASQAAEQLTAALAALGSTVSESVS